MSLPLLLLRDVTSMPCFATYFPARELLHPSPENPEATELQARRYVRIRVLCSGRLRYRGPTGEHIEMQLCKNYSILCGGEALNVNCGMHNENALEFARSATLLGSCTWEEDGGIQQQCFAEGATEVEAPRGCAWEAAGGI